MTKSTWKEAAGVICGLIIAMGGISGIICTIKEGNIFLGLCVLATAVMAFPFAINLWKEGQPKKEEE